MKTVDAVRERLLQLCEQRQMSIHKLAMVSALPPEPHYRSKTLVGVEDSVRPPKCYDFTLDFRENGRFPRADRVVRPYDGKR